jgi:hypothetical protein
MGEKRNAYRVLTVKPEGRRSLGRLKHTWKHIKMNPKERRWQGMVWVHLAQDRNQWLPVINM